MASKNRIYTYEYNFMGDIPHIGVVVFEKEYYYSTEGVQIIEPGTWGSSGPRLKSLEGRCVRTQEELDKFLDKPEFSGYFYSVLNHNCITFANLLVKFLKGKDFTLEQIYTRVASVINATPMNFIVHRLFNASNSSVKDNTV